MKLLLRLSLIGLILVLWLPKALQAQDNWTCDGGPNDVLTAAQDAQNNGDVTRALELAKIAVDVCKDDPVRQGQAQLLVADLENQVGSGQNDPDKQRMQDLTNQGDADRSAGRYQEALNKYVEALAIAQRLKDRFTEGRLFLKIGTIYSRQGQYAKALDYFNRALTIEREVQDRAGEGSSLQNIGVVYRNLGRYAKALDYYNQALVILREIKDRLDEEATLNNIGTVYLYQGQYARALDYFNQALAIQREIGDRLGERSSLSNIGTVYHYQGQYTKALDYFNQALTIERSLGDRPGEGVTLSNIGTVYQLLGQYAEALDYFNQSLDIKRATGDRQGEGVIFSNIGTIYLNQAQYAKAVDYYDQALAIERSLDDRADEITTLNWRGYASEFLNRQPQAIADYKAAIVLIEALIDDAGLNNAIANLLTQYQNSNPYQRLAVLVAQSGDLPDALSYAERGRAILIRTELLNGSLNIDNSTEQALFLKEAVLREALNSAQRTLDALRQDPDATADDIQKAQDALDKARAAYDKLTEDEQINGGFLTRQIAHKAATLEEIRAVLPPDTTLLTYSISAPNSVIFLITDKTLDAVILEATTAQIQEQVAALNADRRANVGALAKLYQLVIAPIADKLKTKHLIIAPDQGLNYVPFAALQAPDKSYLADKFAISMIPSATTLVLLKDRQPLGAATSAGLVLAQPYAPGLQPLTNAKSEAAVVAKLLGVQPILNATESDLRANARGSKVIEISAHAELDKFAPLFSAIYLKADATYDGRFEAREVYELDLTKGTELVVLSGCNTASGGNGEDFGVLTRAFFAAGTPRVIASLWSVDDAATAFLITDFFAERAKPGDDSEALQAAMLATRAKYPDPYFWASFVLTGLP